MEIYFRPLRLDDEAIRVSIIELLRRERVSSEVSVFVELRVDIDFNWVVMVSEVSIYDGYAMRCVSPPAEIVTFDSPFGHYPTSARREVLKFANEIAVNFGADIAVECDKAGNVISLCGAALFGVIGRTIVVSDFVQSVERELIIKSAAECGVEVIEERYTKKELNRFDELFAGDHCGITSVSRCGERLYMTVLAEKIASKLAQPW